MFLIALTTKILIVIICLLISVIVAAGIYIYWKFPSLLKSEEEVKEMKDTIDNIRKDAEERVKENNALSSSNIEELKSLSEKLNNRKESNLSILDRWENRNK